MQDHSPQPLQPLEQACSQGDHLNAFLKQLSAYDLKSNDGDELRRQEAFLRALLASEEQKTQAREAMELEREKLHEIISQLEQMEP